MIVRQIEFGKSGTRQKGIALHFNQFVMVKLQGFQLIEVVKHIFPNWLQLIMSEVEVYKCSFSRVQIDPTKIIQNLAYFQIWIEKTLTSSVVQKLG